MDQETSDLFDELVLMLQEARWEIGALRQVMVDQKLASEEEIEARIEDVKRVEYRDLLRERARRAFEKLANRPKQ